jgi:hypothetical protein
VDTAVPDFADGDRVGGFVAIHACCLHAHAHAHVHAHASFSISIRSVGLQGHVDSSGCQEAAAVISFEPKSIAVRS